LETGAAAADHSHGGTLAAPELGQFVLNHCRRQHHDERAIGRRSGVHLVRTREIDTADTTPGIFAVSHFASLSRL